MTEIDVLGINERYYAGDHWETWIGPKVAVGDPNSQQIMLEVERVFQEANKVKECVDRHRRALTAKPAAWSLTTDGQALDAPDIEAFMRLQWGWMLPRSGSERTLANYDLPAWLDSRSTFNPHRQAKFNGPLIFPNAIAEAMHNRLLGGKGYLRLWTPAKRQNGPPHMQVSLHAPHPGNIEIEEDSDGDIERIKYTYTTKTDQGDEQKVETQWLGDDGKTYFRTETLAGNVEEDSEYDLDLGGRFTVVRLRGVPIVNHSIRRLQDGINYVLTLMLRNLQYGGFLRDIVSNGLPPGDFDATGNFVPSEEGWVEGPGQKTMLQGLPIFDREGNISGYTTPSIDTKDPVDVTPFLNAVRAIAALIYEQFGQGHILAADQSISGISRQQLRQDFVLAVSEDATALQVALSEIYAAAYLLTEQTPPSGFDVAVEPRLAIADPTEAEVNATLAIYNSRLMSQHTAMAQVGIENPEAELQQIADERAERIATPAPDLDAESAGGTDDPNDPLASENENDESDDDGAGISASGEDGLDAGESS
jgi:hypothetical protein